MSRYPTANAALQCMMCAVPDSKFPSLHKIDCVLNECTDWNKRELFVAFDYNSLPRS